MKSAFSRESARTAKGILITLVVLGHMPKEFSLVESLKAAIYNFHIPCFFLLVLTRELPPKLNSLEDAFKIAFARIWPVIPFSCFSFIVYNVLIRSYSLDPLLDQLGKYFLALLLGGYRQFDDSTGLEIYWFMYAFTGFYLLHLWYQWELGIQWKKNVFVIASMVVGSSAVLFAPEIAPSWLAIPLYSYPLFLGSCVIFNKSLELAFFRGKYGLVSEVMLFIVMCSTWARSHSYNLAHLRVPLPWVLADYLTWMTFIALAFKLLNRLSSMKAVYLLFGALGSESLGVYLVHQNFLHGLWFLVERFEWNSSYLFVPLFASTLLASFYAVVFFKRFKNVALRCN